MSVKKCPQIAVRKDYDGAVDFVYIEIDDGITYNREQSDIGNDIMINRGINYGVMGLDIACPITDDMKEEIRRLLVNADVDAGDIYSTMMELS